MLSLRDPREWKVSLKTEIINATADCGVGAELTPDLLRLTTSFRRMYVFLKGNTSAFLGRAYREQCQGRGRGCDEASITRR